MRSAQLALRVCLVAVAGALAATSAHVLTDVAGDYLLAHDTYDGVAHHSRTFLVVAAVLVLLLVAAVRLAATLMSRFCPSRASTVRAMRGALGRPATFALVSAAAAIFALAGMEYFDCSAAAKAVDVPGLFGGSIALGAGTALLAGAAFGWLVHRVARLAAKYEAPIADFIAAVFKTAINGRMPQPLRRGAETAASHAYALLLIRHGRKRGPPASVLA